MRRRVRTVELRSLSFPQDVDAVKKIASEFLGLRPQVTAEGLMTDEFVARLLHASLNQFGILVEFVQDGIREALECGDAKLEIGHFADAYAARTACPDEIKRRPRPQGGKELMSQPH